MYAPGFVTGSLIRRFGTLAIILAGVAFDGIATLIAVDGNSVAALRRRARARRAGLELHVHRRHRAAHRDLCAEREGADAGANDFIVFATMGISSLASGALVTTGGWETMNRARCRCSASSPSAVLWLMWLAPPGARRGVSR